MFDFDAGKLLIIGVVALIVIGPKDLPRVLRQVGQAVARLRRMAGEFQGQFMDAMKEAEFQDIRDEITKIGADTKLDYHFDPVRDVQNELTRAVEPAPVMAPLSPPAPTADFTLPTLPEPAADESGGATADVGTMASAGIAPFALDNASATDESAAEGPKRKIVIAKRRPAAPATREGAPARAAAHRFRNVRPRRPEITRP